jgi:hypothetical protein
MSERAQVSPADLYGAYMRLAPPERWKYGWVMSEATLNQVRQMREQGAGFTMPIATPPVAPDGCWVVLGLPVRTAETISGVMLERLQRRPR